MANMASPEPKRRRLSLSLGKRRLAKESQAVEVNDENDENEPPMADQQRFVSPDKSLSSYQSGFIPKNTQCNNKWAVKNFEDWKESYNARHPEDRCLDGVLLFSEASLWLQRYILGTRKKDGTKYPPKTLHLLLCGLQRYMRDSKDNSFNISDKENPNFKKLYNTCDSYYRQLREEGVINDVKPTEILTKEDEIKLWDSGVLSVSNPQGLLNAVFFLNGKNFVLRGGVEHRSLKLSQIKRNISQDGKVFYTYTEHVSKNRSGGYNQLNVPNKVVHQYQDVNAGERCHVFVLDTYLSKLPTAAKEMDSFYFRPNLKSHIWYCSVPIGKNTLSGMLKNMCAKAGIEGNLTNHSLRAYATTELFQAGIEEKVIQDRTGHRSLSGLRKYERISEIQKETACKALSATSYNVDEQKETDCHGKGVSTTSHDVTFNMGYSSKSACVAPTFTFGSASLSGCVINVYQAASHQAENP
jgi:hypothetical protein